MTGPWQKTIRDFRQESTRTILVVLAIAIGISGFAAVLSAYAVLTRELDKGYLATNPASATLRMDAIDDALISALLAGREVSDAEARRVLSARIKTAPAEWRTLAIFVVKDYGNIRLSRLVPERGAWPPAPGEILIERDAFQVAHAKIGDTVTIRIGQGREQTLRVSGGVHDVGQAQARMENVVYGYITLDTLARLGEEPYLDQLNILVAENRFDERHIRSVAQDVKTLVESRGHSVRRVDIPRPGKHPHTDIMGVLLLGIAALALALPLGILGGRVLCRAFAVLLNFDITSFAVPLWVYLWVVTVGLVVPLLAAAFPVWKGSAISVREALADFGVSRNTFGSGVFDRMMARIGGRSRPLLLSIRNSFRRRTRLALTLLTLAAGGTFFMSAINIRAAMIRTLDRLFDSRKYDLTVAFGSAYPSEQIERGIRNTPGVVRSESWFTSEGSLPAPEEAASQDAAPHPGAALHGGGALGGERFSVSAVPSDTRMIRLDIVEGRDLLPGEVDAMVINTALAAKSPKMKVGSNVSFRMGPALTSWRVVGITREALSPPAAYIPQAFIDERHPGMRTIALLALARTDAASVNGVKAALERSLEQEGIRVAGGAGKADSRFGFDQHMLMIYVFLVIMSGIIAVVGGLGLATSMSLNVMERRRETGVMRAIGARPSIVRLIIVTEGVVVGVLSWALAALAAWPVSRIAGDALVRLVFHSQLDFLFQLQGLFIWLAVAVVVSAVASFLPAWSASQITVWEALAYE